ncbi:hypothetical protein P9Z39_26215 [Bacillus thuringiensis]|uniref:hypothetical protein n=1 Tax=Bacillus thuringiensis TaxID=1428 RepID=UPI0015C4FEE2|nr:hypothetical protein [Bacillus thuringiensis]MEC2709126.1 hypothetical protein [Bacillus thuringiensis]
MNTNYNFNYRNDIDEKKTKEPTLIESARKITTYLMPSWSVSFANFISETR